MLTDNSTQTGAETLPAANDENDSENYGNDEDNPEELYQSVLAPNALPNDNVLLPIVSQKKNRGLTAIFSFYKKIKQYKNVLIIIK